MPQDLPQQGQKEQQQEQQRQVNFEDGSVGAFVSSCVWSRMAGAASVAGVGEVGVRAMGSEV